MQLDTIRSQSLFLVIEVVGSNGNLTGYAGGLEKKDCTASIRRVDMGVLFTPKKGTALKVN